MYSELARNIKELRPFRPFGTACDRREWDSLDAGLREKLIRLGEGFLGFEYPYISAADFMEFTRTGNRVRYEEKSFAKRRALDALALAECAEDKGRFIDDIVNGIFSICEESAWQLPAHNSYIRDTPQLILPDAGAPVLDLFACETGAVLATAAYLLGSRLDSLSPLIRRRIARELQTRIFEPYLSTHFWWMGDGKSHMNNWTVWCTQNVLISVFLSDCGEELKRQVIEKSCRSADYFLDEYGDDGCCDEGAQYYRHAGLCLFNLTEILDSVTGGVFEAVYQERRIKNIASYIYNVHVGGRYYVNFADCSPIAGRAGVREFLFAMRTGNDSMQGFAARDYCDGLPDTALQPDENNLYYRLQSIFSDNAVRVFAESAKLSGLQPPGIYYPSAGLFIVRGESLFLAVKAGDNGDSHNHNDVGSFTVYKEGRPLFIDVGVESYTKKTFSSRRYEIWTMQSDFHNLPTVNGYMQKDGSEYGASGVSHSLPGRGGWIEMDIAGAYPGECGLRTYRRRAAFDGDTEIVIEDSFEFSDEEKPGCNNVVILNFMTYERPCLKPGAEALCLDIGTLGILRISGGSLLEIEEIPVTDARLKTAWEHSVYRIRVQAAENRVEMHIS